MEGRCLVAEVGYFLFSFVEEDGHGMVDCNSINVSHGVFDLGFGNLKCVFKFFLWRGCV